MSLSLGLAGCKLQSPGASSSASIEQSAVFPAQKAPPGGYGDVARVGVENARFTAADGTRLHGFYFPHHAPRAVVLYAHGNGGNVGTWADVGVQLRKQHRVSVMLFDYRGYGLSEGTPQEKGLLQDARAARAWLAQRAGVKEKDIVLMGRSLGGGVMADLAANDGAKALILQSTFTSLPAAAAGHAPLIPTGLVMKNRFDSLSKIKNYHGPLLVSHGDADRVIPFAQGKQLYEAANEPKQFFTVSGGDHNTPEPVEYHRLLDQFLDGLKSNSEKVADHASLTFSTASSDPSGRP
ncbi:MAG: alpha/beta hydrolase [Pirellulales bacterium]|nr:alpha/beta hydrolase [Pirellulales bacterium]